MVEADRLIIGGIDLSSVPLYAAPSEVPPIRRISHVISVHTDLVTEADEFRAALAAEVERLQGMTPEEIVRETAERHAAERAERARTRETAGQETLALDTLLGALGWSTEYAQHFVQPYCECSPFGEDPSLCRHAEDEGVCW